MSSFRLSHLHKLLDPEIRAKNIQWLRWRARELYWSVAHPVIPDPIFVIGCSRSGTTVTFETLAASGHFLHFDYELPQLWDGLYGPLNNGWASEAAGPEHAAPEHRERAMQRFVRVTADGAPGSGLGLAIVQAIAQGHGATVALDSSARLGGLRVTVRFAAAKP